MKDLKSLHINNVIFISDFMTPTKSYRYPNFVINIQNNYILMEIFTQKQNFHIVRSKGANGFLPNSNTMTSLN